MQVLQRAAEQDRLVSAALNTHGTRAVQKLIETLATREQVGPSSTDMFSTYKSGVRCGCSNCIAAAVLWLSSAWPPARLSPALLLPVPADGLSCKPGCFPAPAPLVSCRLMPPPSTAAAEAAGGADTAWGRGGPHPRPERQPCHPEVPSGDPAWTPA